MKPILLGDHKNTWTCVDDGKSVSFNKPLHPQIDILIRKMLSLNPNERPTISEVFNVLKDIKPKEATTGKLESTSVVADKTRKPGLRFGPGFKPTRSIGVAPTDGPIESKTETTSPKTGGGLRGSGLKIADKK